MIRHGKVCVFTLGLLVVGVVGPPVKEQKPPSENEVEEPQERFTMEYARYLQEVVQALEEDEGFRNKLQNASEDDIKSGRIAEELDLVGHHVRNRLDELKRTELERIRHYARQQMELEQGLYPTPWIKAWGRGAVEGDGLACTAWNAQLMHGAWHDDSTAVGCCYGDGNELVCTTAVEH